MKRRLAVDSDEDDPEQSELQVGDDECETSDQADKARATSDVTVWDVIDEYREGDLCINDPAVLAAFDAEIAVIDEPDYLADVRDDVVTVFADGYIDATKRDELLDRLAKIERGLRGEPGTADPDEEASLQTDTHTADTSEPETDIQDDVPTTIQTVLDDVEVATEAPPGTTTTTTEAPLTPAPLVRLTSGITTFQNLLLGPTEQMNDREEVPLVDRILVAPPDGEGMVTVIGQAGAVPFGQPDRPWDSVNVIAVEWGTQDCVDRRSDGSFDARLEAPSGSTLYVLPIQRGMCVGQGIQTGPAAVLAVPATTPAASAPGTFATLGRAGSSLKWSAQGSLTGPGRSINFVVHEGPGEDCLTPRIHLYRLFDSNGEYLTQVNVNVHGPVLTPTGLPIESSEGPSGYYETVEFVDAPNCLQSDQTLTPAELPASLETGWYLPRIMFGLKLPNEPTEFLNGVNTPSGGGLDFEANTGFGYLPMVSVGASGPPRLPATLLNEAPSWGSAGIRGVLAEEDSDRFALGSRRSFAAPFIASPTDPLSGQSVHYTLEPYLPTIGYTGFAAPMPEPLFRLDDDDPGRLSITLTTPDGATRYLAQDAEVEMFVASAWFAGYPVELPFSGPSHTIGLTTGLDDLDLEFEQFGRHTVHLDGTLLSSRGDQFIIQGTYQIWVAEPLDMSLGVFEGTPLEIDDAWNPTVVVEPGVPADITIDIAHYVDGDTDKRQNFSITGTANRFGYFASTQAWLPTEHGEYRTNVTASYLDPTDGTLWMGTRVSASIVATPDTPLVAHGERNSQLARAAGDQILRTWFFNRATDPACGEESCDPLTGAKGLDYPFFSGDIAWLVDMSPIVPIITVDGPNNVLQSVSPQLRPENYCYPEGCVEAPDTYRLRSDTSEGKGTHHRPGDVDSWAYWYSSSMRPDVSVFAAVAEAQGGEHIHWYGHDTYNCQIGLACRDFYFRPPQSGRGGSDIKGDEEGDVKLLFGGAVLKNGDQQHFVPYGSMAVITEEGTRDESGEWMFGDNKGNRICPPYQGAAGGLGTCGPLLTHRGRDVDLFITPTGTRPGNVLEPGDRFTFSGQAWPTLDVAVEVTVTEPGGEVHHFENRANTVGYVDAEGMSFTVEEPGVYEVHVSAIQDRPVPSTGLAPNPVLVADGRTTMTVYGYQHPLSAILGSLDSTYRFYVAEELGSSTIGSETSIVYGPPGPGSIYGWAGNHVEKITFDYALPPGVTQSHYSLTAPGLLIDQGTISGSGTLTVQVDQGELYEAGFTQIILGADTLQLSIAYRTNSGWQARTLNQRGFSPLGG